MHVRLDLLVSEEDAVRRFCSMSHGMKQEEHTSRGISVSLAFDRTCTSDPSQFPVPGQSLLPDNSIERAHLCGPACV